ncbi:N-acetyltransferase family protein [Sorangium sp. So ce385]|uniref:GNAT family N-acetyltransferase n=1 Tax=Sorangium sp. So ce385 TaxID=3133308 RepID=UPI003F5CB532
MIALRALTPDDWATWRDVRLRALADAPHAFGSTLKQWEDASEERWRARLELPGSHNLVAYVDGEPVGMATGAPLDGTCELISMWVAPEVRGRGVGDALVAEILRWAREQGARELRLDVKENNPSAIALYIRHGFIDVGPSRESGERAMVKRV